MNHYEKEEKCEGGNSSKKSPKTEESPLQEVKSPPLNPIIDPLQTGDVILYHEIKGWSWMNIIGMLIEKVTGSPWSHTGVVLKDPTWINLDLKGIFLLESSYEGFPDSEDGKKKLGVQIVPLVESVYAFSGEIYVRKLDHSKTFSVETLEEIHKQVHDKPYDFCPIDWIEAGIKTDPYPQKTSRFWCSALVTYFYTKLGLFDSHKDWSIVRPDYYAGVQVNEDLIGAKFGELVKITK